MNTDQSSGQAQGAGDPGEGEGRLAPALRYFRLEKGLSFLCVSLAVWLIIFPVPHTPLVLANLAVPLAALMLVRLSGGAVQIDGDDPSIPAVGYLLFLPAVAAAFDIFTSYQLAYPKIPLPALSAAALLTAVFGFIVGGRLRTPGSWGHLVLAALALGFAGAVSLNCVLDLSAPQVFRAKVVSKSVYRSEYGARYYLDLDRSYDWMPDSQVSVPAGLYNGVAVKGGVCLYRRGGLFGIPWYMTGFCEGH